VPVNEKYEVEQKYRVVDLSACKETLRLLGAEFEEATPQVDRYFAHPSRDFAATDEAFRLRRDGETNRITYKGPKVDATIKTRQEIELPLADGNDYLDRFSALLEALSFQPVAQVSKLRTTARVKWKDRTVTVCLDEVEEVGDFVEIELVVGKRELADAKAVVLSLASDLGLSSDVRSSYLEMLLDSRSARR
jgi:adenylate cyclase class 2